MARLVAVEPHDRRRSPFQISTSPLHQLSRAPDEKQGSRSYKQPGQTVKAAGLARTMSGALSPAVRNLRRRWRQVSQDDSRCRSALGGPRLVPSTRFHPDGVPICPRTQWVSPGRQKSTSRFPCRSLPRTGRGRGGQGGAPVRGGRTGLGSDRTGRPHLPSQG